MKKNVFKFKRRENGQILKIHHTITTLAGEVKRIRFLHVSFNDTNDFIAAVDSRGNCYMFDLKSMQTWVLHYKLPLCSVIEFVPHCTIKLISGNKLGELMLLDTASGDLLQSIHPFVLKINNISFPSSNAGIFLAATNTDAIIFDLNNFEQKHRLEYPAAQLSIKQMKFLNKSDQMYSIFSNDSIHIWTHDNFHLVERINPIQLRENFLKTSKPQRIDLNINIDDNINILVWNLTKDYTRGLISDVCFSDDGKHMCVTTIDDYLMLFGSSTWDLIQLIHSPGIAVFQSRFFTIYDMPDKILLSVVTLANDAIILDLENLKGKLCVQKEHVLSVVMAKNYALMAILLKTGEIQLFDVNVLIKKLMDSQLRSNGGEDNNYEQQWNSVNDKIQKILPEHRLRSILKEYFEYPLKYRQFIWKHILRLPDNRTAFAELLKKDYHPCVQNYDQLYPLKDVSAHRNLKRIVSALAYWSKVFAQCDFIPKFVFPFVKEFDKNLIFCFEIIGTILLNHGQLWFEFAPLEPINYLGMIENILAYYEPQLIRFYESKNITTITYAWSLLQTAFTEVLDEDQWRQLWDHILSNAVEFMLFSVVAYNCVMKEVIMRLESNEAVQRFFEEQNMIEMKRLVLKIYDVIEKCPEDLNPKRYLKAFKPLSSGFYDKFNNFPRALTSLKENEAKKLLAENRILNEKLYELEKKELAWTGRLEDCLKAEEHTKRLREVEKAYEDAIIKEQDRVAIQRKHLLLYQKQLRESEQNVLEEIRNSKLRTNLSEKENEVEMLLKGFDRNRIREEGHLLFVEEDLKAKEMDLLVKKYNLDANVDTDDEPLSSRYRHTINKLEREKKDLEAEIQMIKNQNRNLYNGNTNNYCDADTTRINAIEKVLEEIQIEFLKIKHF